MVAAAAHAWSRSSGGRPPRASMRLPPPLRDHEGAAERAAPLRDDRAHRHAVEQHSDRAVAAHQRARRVPGGSEEEPVAAWAAGRRRRAADHGETRVRLGPRGEHPVDGHAVRVGQEHEGGVGGHALGERGHVAPTGGVGRQRHRGDGGAGQRRREHRDRGGVLHLALAAGDPRRGHAEQHRGVEDARERRPRCRRWRRRSAATRSTPAGRGRRPRTPRGSPRPPRPPRGRGPDGATATRRSAGPGSGPPDRCYGRAVPARRGAAHRAIAPEEDAHAQQAQHGPERPARDRGA